MIRYSINNTIGTITLNRPKKAHAYNQKMLQELQLAWHSIAHQCNIAIICSTGHSAFCGGADLSEMQGKTDDDAFQLRSQAIFEEIAQSSVVSIAVVHGAAVAGGCELALACDMRVIGPKAYFSLPEVSLGLIPSAGGCTRLSSLIGISRSKTVILGAEKIDSQRALNWGLANRLAEDPYLAALQWAEQISGFDPMALRLAKRVLTDPSLAKERLCEAILYRRKTSSD